MFEVPVNWMVHNEELFLRILLPTLYTHKHTHTNKCNKHINCAVPSQCKVHLIDNLSATGLKDARHMISCQLTPKHLDWLNPPPALENS